MEPAMKEMVQFREITASGLSVRLGNYIVPLVLLVVDYIAVLVALMTAWHFRAVILPQVLPFLVPFSMNNKVLYFIIPITYMLFLAYEGMYVKRLPFWKNTELLFKICSYATVAAITVIYFFDKDNEISRIFVILTWSLSFVYLLLSRYVLQRILLRIGLWARPVILLGEGKHITLLADMFAREPLLGYTVAAMIRDADAQNIEAVIRQSKVQDVIIALTSLKRDNMLNVVYRVQPYVRRMTIIPDFTGIPLSNMELITLYDEKTLMLSIRNNMMLKRNRLLKQFFDWVFSLSILLFIWPLLLLLAGIVYLDSPGPVLFRHRRIGRHADEFWCYKFRTMVIDADERLREYLQVNVAARQEWEREFKLKKDPRITPIGRFLRRTSLDELPQLLNVLKGDMSLVGPRPIVRAEIAKYGEYIGDYYLVRPGITGYWQVSGRNDIDYEQRVQLDSWYVRNWSMWQDLVLLCRTARVVCRRDGAY